jgi:hypothetical protein
LATNCGYFSPYYISQTFILLLAPVSILHDVIQCQVTKCRI